ncbi:DNA-processing protein DprA [Nesterenkonia marinintestina]|uniref:DNA-processing protein DprA n=1 Tax=Nesterenkonia marinintestina TaxID=2979865 RepID=UPI0021BF1682|nr:DNA-protecting protein DprA [Nesterenkonia sp. GX14115]
MDERRRARAALSRLIEPGDLLAGALVAEAGPEAALAAVRSDTDPGEALRTRVGVRAEAAGLGPRQRDLRAGLTRWRTRRGRADPDEDLARMDAASGGLIIPEDDCWPTSLDDLGPAAPVALWYRTSGRPAHRLPAVRRSVAVVGSREITDYGLRVTSEITEDLVRHGVCVVSGGAYGIDAAAHRAALRTGMRVTEETDRTPAEGTEDQAAETAPTVAVLAGGLDRWYPAGNASLLQGILDHGVLLSELPPGCAPTRHRFLQRNRLIAALAAATVVVEARWRSGAQNTASHALGIDRPVGAVPGSVYSASSAGCHRLLRSTPAQVVTDAADVAELMAHGRLSETWADAAEAVDAGTGPQERPLLSAEQLAAGHTGPTSPAAREAVVGPDQRPEDGLSAPDRLLYDALPVRARATPGRISEAAGVPLTRVLGGLSRLERSGLADQVEGRWRKSRRAGPGRAAPPR